MLSAREAFKVGFLGRCVEDGLTDEEIEKRADDVLAKTAGFFDKALAIGQPIVSGITNIAKPIVSPIVSKATEMGLGVGLPLALASPFVVGGAAGYGLARATDIDDTDVDEMRTRQLIDEYNRLADKAKRESMARAYAKARARTGRMF